MVVIVTVDKETGDMLGTPEVITRASSMSASLRSSSTPRGIRQSIVRQRTSGKVPPDWQALRGTVRDSLASHFYERPETADDSACSSRGMTITNAEGLA